MNRHAPSLAFVTATLIDTQQHFELALTHLSCSDKLVVMVFAAPPILTTVKDVAGES